MKISPPYLVGLISITLVVGCHLLGVTGCNKSRKQQIASEIAGFNSEADSVKRAIADQESALEVLNQRLDVQNSQLAEYTASVEGYMLDHKMAVAAIVLGFASGGVALDDTNAFSEDAEKAGGLTVVVVALWVIGNMDEVSAVVKTLNQADAHVRSLKAIAGTSLAIQRQQRSIQASETKIDVLAQKVSALEQESSRL